MLITTRCNLSCEYCFAKEKMDNSPCKDISLHDLKKVLFFLKKSDYKIFRMMGGEPTFHPNFKEFLELALNEKMRVDLLSNATWHNKYNDYFSRISPNRLLFLLNIDHPRNYSASLWEKIETNLNSLKGRKGVSLSFNIFEKMPSCEYIIDLIDKYKISTIRLSFSLPIYGYNNKHLDIHDYDELSSFIISFVREVDSKNAKIHLDNAVPLCIFSYEQAGELILKGVLDLKRNSKCEPIIDIGPDLSVWCCFCLSKIFNRKLDEFENLHQIQNYYKQIFEPYQNQIFPMEKCYECQYQKIWGCQGGCTVFSIKNKISEFHVREKTEIEKILDFKKTKICLSENVKISRYDIPYKTIVLTNNISGAEIEVNESFENFLENINSEISIEESVETLLKENNFSKNQDPVSVFEQSVMRESVNDFLDGMLKQGFLTIR